MWHAKEPSLLNGHKCRAYIGQNLQPLTGNGDISEKFSSGKKNSKQTNKQTNFNNIINRFVYEICRFHAALCGLKQPDLSLSTLSFNLKKYFVSFYNEVKTTAVNVTCFITRRDKSGSRQSSCVGRLKCYHLFILCFRYTV